MPERGIGELTGHSAIGGAAGGGGGSNRFLNKPRFGGLGSGGAGGGGSAAGAD